MTAHPSVHIRASALLCAPAVLVCACLFFVLPSPLAAFEAQQPSAAPPPSPQNPVAKNVPHPLLASRPPVPALATKAPPAKALPPLAHAPVSQRDPFHPLITAKIEGAEVVHLPSGKAGLTVATLRITGLVRSPDGMIAVASNPESHVFFLHQGDQLYDARVQKIALDGVVFLQNVKDRFGHPVQHLVTRGLYSDSGAQK
jgi:hypothetical protein